MSFEEYSSVHLWKDALRLPLPCTFLVLHPSYLSSLKKTEEETSDATAIDNYKKEDTDEDLLRQMVMDETSNHGDQDKASVEVYNGN